MRNKSIVAFLLLICIVLSCFAACSKGKEQEVETTATADEVTTAVTEVVTSTATEPSSTQKTGLQSADYYIKKHDFSFKMSSPDEKSLTMYYERVILSGNSPEINSINAYIKADYDKFYREDTPRASEIKSSNMYGDFVDTVDAQVVQNADGVFSIKMSQDWYMGGVCNESTYGLTYHLDTGKKATLTSLTGMSFSSLKPQLDAKLKARINPYFYDVLNEMNSMEDYPFYVKNGEIVITFPEYVLSIGMDEAPTVYTGIYIK